MASGWLISIASIAFSYSSPVKKMSKERPLNSLFHPAIFVSILGQALIHLFCMVTAVKMATEAMGGRTCRSPESSIVLPVWESRRNPSLTRTQIGPRVHVHVVQTVSTESFEHRRVFGGNCTDECRLFRIARAVLDEGND